MKWYVCASFARRSKCAVLACWLKSRGDTVTARWVVDGVDATDDGVWADMPDEQHADWAAINLDDIDAADAIVILTEHPGSEYVRGGRHVETGYAMSRKRVALLTEIHIIGPAENCFHHLRGCVRHVSVEDFKLWMKARDAGVVV